MRTPIEYFARSSSLSFSPAASPMVRHGRTRSGCRSNSSVRLRAGRRRSRVWSCSKSRSQQRLRGRPPPAAGWQPSPEQQPMPTPKLASARPILPIPTNACPSPRCLQRQAFARAPNGDGTSSRDMVSRVDGAATISSVRQEPVRRSMMCRPASILQQRRNANARRQNLRPLCPPPDPLHGGAVHVRVARPRECRLRRADDEPRFGLLAHVFGFGAGIFFLGYFCSRCPRICCWRASARGAGFHVSAGVGRDFRGQRVRARGR